MKIINTFSIVAYDPERDEWGVAVQSKFLAVGSAVSWARAGAGAVATQAYANLSYGPGGLDMMEMGVSAEEIIKRLTNKDKEKNIRQVGMVDKFGMASAFTGSDCHDWAGHVIGNGYTCQGNILIAGTVEAMAEQFEQVRNKENELSDWLVKALEAGQRAGGDKRGRQSAAVLVVRKDGGYGGNTDRYLDLRVDDDPEPIKKLKRLLDMHHLFFGETNPDDLIPLSDVARELQKLLIRTGHYKGSVNGTFDDTTRKSLRNLVGMENLEERWDGKGEKIDRYVINYLLERFQK